VTEWAIFIEPLAPTAEIFTLELKEGFRKFWI